MTAPPDLGAVDELCLLARSARRLGCEVRLVGVTTELRELLELAGVTELLLDPPTDIDQNRTDLR